MEISFLDYLLTKKAKFISCRKTAELKTFANKKVLLHERERHTAHCVAIAISCYSGGGGPLTNFFFFQSEHVSSQIWCQKISPLLGGGVPWQKFFFPVWTCIKPNLVSKKFPFTGGGVPRQKIFFPILNMYQAKSGVKNFSLYWDRNPPPPPPSKARSGTPLAPLPPRPRLDQVPPSPPCPRLDQVPPPQVWIDTQSENITSRHPSDAGGKY